MFHVKQDPTSEKFYVALNETRVSHLYGTQSGADAAYHRMVRTCIAEYIPRDGSVCADDIYAALDDAAWNVDVRARSLRAEHRLPALPPHDDANDIMSLIAIANSAAAQRGWPNDVRDELRALALDAAHIDVARAVYW